MSDICTLHRGTKPLLISLPHDGTSLPADIAARLTPGARRVPDTDWHISQLYAFARDLGASMLVPNYSRYVVDLNRPPDDVSLYPGQNTTGLCPHVQFSGEPVYLPGQTPSDAEIIRRVETYWRPYHRELIDELTRLKSVHGRVVLWEAHSIKSVVPFLFEGRLPDFNLGTANGTSCSSALQRSLTEILEQQKNYTSIVNGRFKGGYITREYGKPGFDVHAVQLELAQCNYMDEEAFTYLPARASGVQSLIRALLETTLQSK
jgi:N-formylglutamate deformylase